MMLVSQLLQDRPAPFLLDAGFNAVEAAQFLRKHRIGGAPVVRNGEPVGFCSERDIVFRVVAEQHDPLTTSITDIMSKVIVTADIDSRVDDCESKMRAAHVRHLPILEHGRIVACLSLRDLLQSEVAQAEFEVKCLEEYVRGTNA